MEESRDCWPLAKELQIWNLKETKAIKILEQSHMKYGLRSVAHSKTTF